MAYRKPEVQKLGDAINVIQVLNLKTFGTLIDSLDGRHDFNAAYDLDE